MTDSELGLFLTERLNHVQSRIMAACQRAGRDKSDVTLVAVTKTVSPRVAALVAQLGIPDLGESRPQELWKKAAAVPTARWHLIGHLQRNKIDKTVPLTARIHSVDSPRLLESLEEFASKRKQEVPILLEVNCSREEAKGGFSVSEVLALSDRLSNLSMLRVDGLMTMAAFHEDPELSRSTFRELRELRDQLRAKTGLPLPHLSMGMSNDFEIAIEEGATWVRIGTTIFEGLEQE